MALSSKQYCNSGMKLICTFTTLIAISQKRVLPINDKKRFFMSANKSLKVYAPDRCVSPDIQLAEGSVHADFLSSSDDFMEN